MLRWIGAGEYADGWRNFLQADELEEQLKLGRKADRKVLKNILGKYSGDTPGLSSYYFAAVRQALEAWLVDLATPTAEELPQAARDAKADFKPVAEEDLSRAKSAVQRALTNLEYLLGPTSGWRAYLRWDDLAKQLKEEKPDVAVLGGVLQAFSRDFRGLEMPQFTAVRSALDKYLAKLRVAQDDEAEANCHKQLEALAASLTAYQSGQKPGDLSKAGEALGWLEERHLAPRITKLARREFWKPNLLLEISPEVATYGFQESRNETERIDEYRNNAQVVGNSRTVGQTAGKLVPHRGVGLIHNEFRGTTSSRTTAYASQATIYSRATTTIHAIKQIALDRHGFRDWPATAAAYTESYTENIDSAYASQARDRVESARPENNANASRRAEDKIRDRMDQDTRKQLDEANQDFYKQFVNPLTKYDAYPPDLRFSTTKEAVQVRGVQFVGGRLAATDDPPTPPSDKALVTRMHETWLNNTARAMYGGRAVAEEEFRKDVTDILGRMPERLRRKNQNPPWTISFAAEAPISVQVGENSVIVSVQGTSFRSGKSKAQEIPMNITASYQVSKDDKGPKYVRQGELQVLPPDVVAKFDKDGNLWLNRDEEKALTEGAKLSAAQASLRGQLQDDFAELFEEEIRPEPQTLSGRWESLGQLKPDYLAATPGWLTTGYVVDKPAGKEPEKKSEASPPAKTAAAKP
jgi:hypothetical protein